jgi:hypothetical protein
MRENHLRGAPPAAQPMGRLVAGVCGPLVDRRRGTGRSRFSALRPSSQANYKPAGESAGNLMLGFSAGRATNSGAASEFTAGRQERALPVGDDSA